MTQPGNFPNEELLPDGLGYDLADHFMACAKLGRYLTVASGSRFIITDDLRDETVLHEAAAVAAIFSKDTLVAEAALLPLSTSIPMMEVSKRDKYERLFCLIEQETLAPNVKESAQALIESRFRASEIRDLEAELGEKLSPARIRYREFLLVVKQLMERKISAKPFVDEFKGFTQDVAGRLDFGIYSFCLDSLFRSLEIPEAVKKLLVLELLHYPPLIRRELLSNVLAYPGQTMDFISFVANMIERHLEPTTVVEIELLKDLKLRRFSMEAVSALAEKSHVLN
jgi:hypothetical protein